MTQLSLLRFARGRRNLAHLCVILALALNCNARAEESAKTAPNCTLTLSGDTQSRDLRQFSGEVLYVDFWASWCGPCAQSFPFLSDLNRDYHSRGLRIVGINLDENFADAKDFLAQHPAGFSVASGVNEQCAEDFGVQAMPSSYLIDRNGVIRHEHRGFRPGEAEQLRKLVEQLLAEPPASR
jgi:thiol-disulfide isomerase/thioredoxin